MRVTRQSSYRPRCAPLALGLAIALSGCIYDFDRTFTFSDGDSGPVADLSLDHVTADQSTTDVIKSEPEFLIGLGGGGGSAWAVAVYPPTGDILVAGNYFQRLQAKSELTPVAGKTDAYIVRLDQYGNVKWANSIGGPDSDDAEWGQAIALDSKGAAYITGRIFGQATAKNGSNNCQVGATNEWNAYVAKFDFATGACLWARATSRPKGPMLHDKISAGFSVAVDASNNVYVAGRFTGIVDFGDGTGEKASCRTAPTFTPCDMKEPDNFASSDIYYLKYDEKGNIQWAKHVGWNATEQARGITLDGADWLYLTGMYSHSGFKFPPVTGKTVELFGTADANIFVARCTTADGKCEWVRGWGSATGTGSRGNDIAWDGQQIWIVGDWGEDLGSTPKKRLIYTASLAADGSSAASGQSAGKTDELASGAGVASAGSGRVFVVGSLMGTVAHFDATNSLTLNGKGQHVVIAANDGTSYQAWDRLISHGDNNTSTDSTAPHHAGLDIAVHQDHGIAVGRYINALNIDGKTLKSPTGQSNQGLPFVLKFKLP